MTPLRQPTYFAQLSNVVEALRPDRTFDTALMRRTLRDIAGNAFVDDGTDRQLDFASFALFHVALHNMMPGRSEGLPVDYQFVDNLDAQIANDHPLFHRPRLLEMLVNLLCDGPDVAVDLTDSDEQVCGLLTRVAAACYLIDADATETGQSFDETLTEYLDMTARLLADWQNNGDFDPAWPLPHLS